MALTLSDIFSSWETAILPSVLAIFAGLLIFLTRFKSRKQNEPPYLPETIPYITNAYQVVLNTSKFIKRVKASMGNKTIMKYKLGTKPVYLVRGEKNLQTFIRGSRDLDSEPFMYIAIKGLWGFTREDADKFGNDPTGRLKISNRGTESIPESQRYWHGIHKLYDQYLTSAEHSSALATKFLEIFNERLEQYPLNEWTTTSVMEIMKEHMFNTANITIFGSQRLKLAPETQRLYWIFEEYGWHFLYGMPRWMFPGAYKARDEFNYASKKYLDSAWKNFDWKGPDAESEWEPHFGSRFARESAKWLKESGFHEESQKGFFSMLLFALHGNTLATVEWMFMYLILDQELYRAVREEVMTAYDAEKKLDVVKLGGLSLIQAVFTETLRLHMSFNNIREAKAPIVFDGYQIEKGAWLQTFSGIAQREEESWGREGHPADEFWVGRHLTFREERDGTGNVRQVPEFSIAGKSGIYFPFGGGTGMCPARHFAKQESLIALATIVARFDVEFLEWTKLDGSKSDREARADEKFAGAGTMPPDRDLKLRWKRLW
ncbi:cholesterol 7-alpha-monooxygenase 4 [Podospora fimiseda]|uniref:Cholesterol 7-alpha-monooxygenase 4 n=1 Tax=Podospora fimiseda TaxID=252190 RepID=A0AAN6YQR6_9PEZI|nr:cholesterol 7-alpha-monooxygenase 4 [Podospora fimiseda]